MAPSLPQASVQSEVGTAGEPSAGTQLTRRAVAVSPADASIDTLAGFLHVPVLVQVEVPVVAMTVGDLFRLDKGAIVNTAQLTGANVPLRVGGRLLAWGEFQVIGDHLAVRVAELA
jgi:flagellar motor switch/type III secretory pathway protein FliN